MYTNIWNPKNNNFISIFTKEGMNTLKSYIKHIGGAKCTKQKIAKCKTLGKICNPASGRCKKQPKAKKPVVKPFPVRTLSTNE